MVYVSERNEGGWPLLDILFVCNTITVYGIRGEVDSRVVVNRRVLCEYKSAVIHRYYQ